MRKTTLLLVLVLLSLSACGNHVTSKQDVITKCSADDLKALAESVSVKKLKKAWGEPQTKDACLIWSEVIDDKNKYIIALTEGDKITHIQVSMTMYVVIAGYEENPEYCFVDFNDYVYDSKTLCKMPKEDYFGNKIEAEYGDLFLMEGNGVLLSFPGIIGEPYSAVKMGHASEDELKKIDEEMEKVEW